MKKIFILLIINFFAFANSSFQIANNIVNDASKTEKLKLLFPKGSYLKGGFPDLKAISQVLKMNSLLQYSYSDAKDIDIKFKADANAILFLKAITTAFEQIGINYYLANEYIKNNDEISVSFRINSKYIIDPGSIYEALQKMNVMIENVYKDGLNFTYELDFSRAFITADYTLLKNEVLELNKPLDPYFIKLNGILKLEINIGQNHIWYPKIEFLDKNLNLIKTYKNDKNTKYLNIEVPDFCEFVIVGDLFTLENIKHGLNIKGL